MWPASYSTGVRTSTSCAPPSMICLASVGLTSGIALKLAGQIQGVESAGRPTPSIRPARSHGLIVSASSRGGGAVSRRNCSIAAAIAAASAGLATEWVISIRGRRGACLPLRATGRGYRRAGMPEIPVFDHDTVLAAVTPSDAIERVRDAFVRHYDGEWVMPSKVYLDAPDGPGDFRAMPARGGGLAILKWITSFPSNRERGLPVVMGLVCVSDASDGRPLALIDARAITMLRTGAVAAVAAQELAREDAATVGLVGCGVYGAWAARCLAAAEYGPGLCYDVDPDAAGALAGELGWEAGALDDALACDVVTCVTPGNSPVVTEDVLHAGAHLNMLGADGPGKSEAEPGAVARCRLFCDEWHQASHGGELTAVVEAGLVTREQVTELGAVMTGNAEGRSSNEEMTLFDSTGLAIQDLAITHAVLEAQRAGVVKAPVVRL